MMFRFRALLSCVATSSLLLAGCVVAKAVDAPDLEGSAWILAELPGRTLVADSSVTLSFEGGRAFGSDGCNRYSFGYQVTDSKIAFTAPGISTQMACAPELMTQADSFRTALTGAAGFHVDAQRLQILDGGGAVLASFVPQSLELAGTSWEVTGYNNGREAVVSALVGTKLTVAFSADGKVSGSAGCNRFMGSFHQSGSGLSFGPAATTRKACPSPEGIMEQEQQFLKALGTVSTARLEGDRLELRTQAGALAATLAKAPVD